MRDIMEKSAVRKDSGFVLVWALLLMVVLLILGVSGIGTSIFETAMTVNDTLHKQSFFQADGGANVAAMLIEENVSCSSGFTANLAGAAWIEGAGNNTGVLVEPGTHLSLYQNAQPGVQPVPPLSDADRDAYYFYNATDPTGTVLQHTNIKTGGTVIRLAGGSAGVGMGVLGAGHNAAIAGTASNYDTFSQYINIRQSQNIVEILWQHINGIQGTCNY